MSEHPVTESQENTVLRNFLFRLFNVGPSKKEQKTLVAAVVYLREVHHLADVVPQFSLLETQMSKSATGRKGLTDLR